jgi:hypothetical protein
MFASMKFSTPRRRNPFDKPLVAFLTHVTALCIACTAGYFSTREATWLPLIVGSGVITVMEAAWLYFRFRH